MESYSYVKDQIVIELVKLQIELLEKDQKSWIIEGFPKTELQAIALQKMGIIPDKFILLNQDDSCAKEAIKNNINAADQWVNYSCTGKPDLIEATANMAVMEYN